MVEKFVKRDANVVFEANIGGVLGSVTCISVQQCGRLCMHFPNTSNLRNVKVRKKKWWREIGLETKIGQHKSTGQIYSNGLVRLPSR